MAKTSSTCPICGNRAQLKSAIGDFSEVDCSDCGRFEISHSFAQAAAACSAQTRRLSLQRAMIRAPYGSPPRITTYDLP